jgi:hypothetical protein
VTGPGAEVTVTDCELEQFHCEEDYPGPRGVCVAEDVTLTGRRVLTWITRSVDVETVFRRVGPVAHLHVDDGPPSTLVTPGVVPRLLVEDCEIESAFFATPKRTTIQGGSLGEVGAQWQYTWAQYPGGVLTLRDVDVHGAWRSVGLGTVVLEGCRGSIDLTVEPAPGPYRPGIDGHLVVVRDGVTRNLSAGRHTI